MTVNRARFTISGLMVVVVLASLDCVAIRSPMSGQPLPTILLLLGALPMANILVVGLLPALANRERQSAYPSFLAGFEIVGWAMLLSYAFAATSHPGALYEGIVALLKWLGVFGHSNLLPLTMVILLVPQLALSLLGGWLSKGLRDDHPHSLQA